MQAIAGETGQIYNATANGNYAVIISQGNCVDTSACVPVFILNTEEHNEIGGISIYPNPSHGQFTLKVLQDIMHS